MEDKHEARDLEFYEKKYGETPVNVKGRIKIPYKWHVGAVASKFLSGIKTEGKIRGLRCAKCEKVYIPPRESCLYCFGMNTEWVELPLTGRLESFTIIRDLDPGLAKRPLPYAIGLVRLDGADTCLAHFIEGADLESLRIGERMSIRFQESRNGNILDIKGFVRSKT